MPRLLAPLLTPLTPLPLLDVDDAPEALQPVEQAVAAPQRVVERRRARVGAPRLDDAGDAVDPGGQAARDDEVGELLVGWWLPLCFVWLLLCF